MKAQVRAEAPKSDAVARIAVIIGVAVDAVVVVGKRVGEQGARAPAIGKSKIRSRVGRVIGGE